MHIYACVQCALKVLRVEQPEGRQHQNHETVLASASGIANPRALPK